MTPIRRGLLLLNGDHAADGNFGFSAELFGNSDFILHIFEGGENRLEIILSHVRASFLNGADLQNVFVLGGEHLHHGTFSKESHLPVLDIRFFDIFNHFSSGARRQENLF